MTASFWTLRPIKSSTSALALSLLVCFGTRAEAADDFAKRVNKAQQCYEKKLYDCAINELEAAYLIRPMPALLLNIAHAYLDFGRPRDAIVYYDRYMSEEKNLAPEARADVEKFKRQAEEKLGQAQPVTANPTPQVVNPTPEPPEKPPEVTQPVQPVTPTQPLVVSDGKPSAAAKWAPVGVMAVGGALLISGFAVGGVAMSAAKQVVAGDGAFDAALDQKGKTLGRAAIALDVIGGVALVGGLVPTIIRLTKKAPPASTAPAAASEAPQVSVLFTGRGLAVLGRF